MVSGGHLGLGPVVKSQVHDQLEILDQRCPLSTRGVLARYYAIVGKPKCVVAIEANNSDAMRRWR